MYGFKTVREMEKVLPQYRKSRCLYFDEAGQPILVAQELSFMQDFPLGNPIAELEDSVKDGLTIVGGTAVNFIREKFNIPAFKANISGILVSRIVNAVNNSILDFLNETILELDYANVHFDIFEATRLSVDEELVKISPSTLEKLVTTYGKLSTVGTPLEFSEVAFACRDILQDFTDSIFKPEYLQENEKLPLREQTKNKVYYTLRAGLQGKKGKELELLSSQIDFLLVYFDKLTSYIQKETHPKGFEATREDANRCIIYTYLVIGDILKLTGTSGEYSPKVTIL